MDKLPISVFIIAKNEGDRVHRAILSVKSWVNEVVVVDSGSNDDTVEVAKKSGALVSYNEWKGYGQQKRFAESLCRNNWLLNLDADEEVSPELKDEINELFKPFPPSDLYSLDCVMMLPGQERPPVFPVSTRTIRLYNKTRAGFRDSAVHDSVVSFQPENKIIHLKGVVYHRSFRNYSHEVAKINFYTDMQAEDWMNRSKHPPSYIRILCEPLVAFIKAYILRRYFMYGLDGYLQSVVYAFAKTIRLAKIREKQKLNK